MGASFGVEEGKVGVLGHIDALVVEADKAVVDAAELQVAIGKPAFAELIFCPGVHVILCFQGVVVVIPVFDVVVAQQPRPSHIAKMIAVVLVGAAAKAGIQPVLTVVGRQNRSVKVVVEPALPDEVGAADGIAAHHQIGQVVPREALVVAELLVIAAPVGVKEGAVERPVLVRFVGVEKLVVVLLVVVGFILIKLGATIGGRVFPS